MTIRICGRVPQVQARVAHGEGVARDMKKRA